MVGYCASKMDAAVHVVITRIGTNLHLMNSSSFSKPFQRKTSLYYANSISNDVALRSHLTKVEYEGTVIICMSCMHC